MMLVLLVDNMEFLIQATFQLISLKLAEFWEEEDMEMFTSQGILEMD